MSIVRDDEVCRRLMIEGLGDADRASGQQRNWDKRCPVYVQWLSAPAYPLREPSKIAEFSLQLPGKA